MIYITGDTHIPIDIHKLRMSNFPEQKEMTKDDYVIVCGDFGGVWDNGKEELYWRNWLDEKPFTTLFVDGNHENFHRLNNEFPEVRWKRKHIHKISDSIYHLMRGQVFDIDGIRFFIMGGASSHDKQHRKENVSWWADELPSNEEYDMALKALDEVGWKVDVILSHCAPDSISDKLASWYEHDKLTNFLETVKQDCQYQKWFFGHYHIDIDVDEKHFAMYNRIIKTEDMIKA
jgi:predicted phosphodiesterase